MQSDTIKKTGVYVHIPFCRSRCSYCGFVSSVDEFNPHDYVAALINEIGERVSGDVDTIYIGGGTPSILPRGLLARIFKAIREHANIASGGEITVEANPDSCTDEFLDEIKESGVNRISLGVQSLDDSQLKAVSRRHTAAQAIDAVKRIFRRGLNNVSCDIIIGLPGQTEKSLLDSVQILSDLDVSHISCYALSVEEGTPLYKSGYSFDDDIAADMYESAYNKLLDCGFGRYEVSNFCRNGKYCRHNVKYWTLEPYIGVGAAAHSFCDNRRSYNTSDIGRYIAGDRCEKGEIVSEKDLLEEYIMLGMRTAAGIDFYRLDTMSGYDWRKSKERELDELFSANMIERTRNGICLAENAYFVMNEVILKLI